MKNKIKKKNRIIDLDTHTINTMLSVLKKLNKRKNKKIKNQKGFIQIPLLIAIIAGVLVLGGGYFGVKQYQNYQAKQIEKEKVAQEVQQQKDSEVEKLRQEVEAQEKDKQDATQPQPVPKQPAPVISTPPVVSSGSIGKKVSIPATPATLPTSSGGGGSGGGSSPMVPVDPTIPRSISDIQAINITENSVTINWVTKELANGKVSYSTSPSFTQIVDCSSGYSSITGEPCKTSISPSPSSVAMEVVDSTKRLNHSLNLNNLIGGTIYYFEVSSVWTNGSVTSTDHSFTTLASS